MSDEDSFIRRVNRHIKEDKQVIFESFHKAIDELKKQDMEIQSITLREKDFDRLAYSIRPTHTLSIGFGANWMFFMTSYGSIKVQRGLE